MSVIVWFDDVTAGDTARVGGKGANLGECARAGLPVPPGFCVSTDAYREATREVAAALAADAARGDAALARRSVLEGPIPEQARLAICEAYARMGRPPVAVRSSATAEDSAEASFAGQQDTCLGVVGEEAVLAAVRRCWSSLWTDRAVEYRRRQGVPDEGLAIAVVVQEMVAADTSGVLFTRDPVTGDDGMMLASSSYGLGESVVAALVTPDTFTLARRSATVVSRSIGSKQTRIDQVPDGGTSTSEVGEEERARQSISDADLLRLLDLGERVEAHYGAGQDVEWAFAGDVLHLLQARPITTRTSIVEGHAAVRGSLGHTLRDDLIEHFPAPFPLDMFAVHRVQGVLQDLMCEAGLSAAPAESLLRGDDDGIIRITVTNPRPTPAMLWRLPALLVRGVRHDPSAWAGDEARLRAELERLAGRARTLATVDDDAALDLVREAVAHAASVTADRFVRYIAPMMVNRAVAAWLLRFCRPGLTVTPEDLYAGVTYKTAEITAAITELAGVARGSGVADVLLAAPKGAVGPALAAEPRGREFERRVEAFLAAHGARTARLYLPFSNRSWREDPEALHALVAAMLAGAPLEQAGSDDPARDAEERLPRFLRGRWRTNTARLRARHVAREGTVYLIEEIFCVARAGMDEIARRLSARQQLDDPGDIALLYFHEVEAALHDRRQQPQGIVARRRRKRGTAEAIWWDRGRPDHDDGAVRGLPASAGRAIGTVRVIRSPDEFHRLRSGDVLVCPYTDPTWTPLFVLAAAVVADSGGPLSHAAIVAREYGIPAVLGAGHATGLPDGATVLVDGTNGIVTIVDHPSP